MAFIKRHPIFVTVILFFLAVQLFSLSVDKRREADPFSRFVLTLAYYPQKLFSVVTGGIAGTWRDYISLVNLRQENIMLREEVRKLRGEKFSLRETELQNQRLKRLLDFKETFSYPVVSANVIGGSPSIARSQVVIIDRGKEDGVSEGMPVTTYEGVVGRVFLAGDKSAEVILITDDISAVDAYIHRTRARGVVKGKGNRCMMEYIEKRANVGVGDKVISSGKDGFFPKGVVIGTVTEINVVSGLIKAYVSPDVDLDSLEEVLVILKLPETRFVYE